MKKWIIGFLLVFLIAGAVGYYLSTRVQENPSEETEEEKPAPEESSDDSSPFSGIESDQPFDERPVMAVINNHPDARPQTGLAEADMIFELLAEGNVTRFLALYQSEFPAEMGPIRSARDYFIELAESYGAFFLAHGYSPDAQKMLNANRVDHINGISYDGTLFERSADRAAPHNSYITYDNVLAGMEKVQASLEYAGNSPYHFYESAEDAKLEEQASSVEVMYGSNQLFHNVYTYDPTNLKYSRTAGGIPTTDKESSAEIEVSNVLFLETGHQTIDSEGRLSIDLSSGGDALIFQGGGVLKAEWNSIDGMLVPVLDGEIVKLAPGKSWIHLVPATPGMDEMIQYSP